MSRRSKNVGGNSKPPDQLVPIYASREADPKLPDWVKVGASFALFGKVYHVRGIVDDRAVLRWWRKPKQRWEYVVEDETFFFACESGIERR